MTRQRFPSNYWASWLLDITFQHAPRLLAVYAVLHLCKVVG